MGTISAVILVLGLLFTTACPSTSPTTASGTTTTTTTTTRTTSPSVTGTPLGTIEVLGVWGAEEQASFMAMIAPWMQSTGGKVNFTGTRDLIAVLQSRVAANNAPDIAILPNPGQMQAFASAGKLIALNKFLDMTQINKDYASAWVNLGSSGGNMYAVFMKAANKSMVWYNPKTFSSNSWSTPTSWDDMIALSNKIVSDKKTPAVPWSMGMENGAASGWPGTDWIAQILLAKYGGSVYDDWVAHRIPWTDSRIKDAWQMWGTIATNNTYISGGPQAVLATNFQDASFLPFQTPPKAAMYYEGDFIEGFITAQFPTLKAETDFNFFAFPNITSQYNGAVTGGADLVCAFKDNPTVRSFVAYMATAQAQTIWVKRGGFTSVNKSVNLNDYPDAIAKKSAQQLTGASLFRFGAGDTMPAAMQTAWWQGILQYLQNPSQLDTILANLETAAKAAYSGGSPTPSATK